MNLEFDTCPTCEDDVLVAKVKRVQGQETAEIRILLQVPEVEIVHDDGKGGMAITRGHERHHKVCPGRVPADMKSGAPPPNEGDEPDDEVEL